MIGNYDEILSSIKIKEIFDVSIDLISISEISGKFIKLSNSWESVLGYELSELENMNYLDFVHPDDLAQTIKQMEILNNNQEISMFVNRYRCKNGDFKYIEWNSHPFGGYCISIARDVTEKIKLENEIKESNWLLEQSQKIANLGSYSLDIKNDHWVSTHTLDEIFGIDSSFIKNFKGWISIVNPSYQKTLEEYYFNDVLKGKQPFDKEYQIRKVSTGETIWVHGLGTVFYDDNNKPVSMIGTIQDINKKKIFLEYHKQIEMQLFEEKERLRITFESIGDGIITVDTNAIVNSLNKNAEKLTGWKSEEAVGKPFNDVFIIKNELTGLSSKNPVEEVLKNDLVFELENHAILTSKDDRKHDISDSASPIKNRQGETVGVVMVFRDVTEKKTSERELKQAAEIIEKMNTGIYVYYLDDVNDDRSLRLISANLASAQILGIKKEEIIGKYIDEIFPNLRRKGIPKKFANTAKTGKPFETEDFCYYDDKIIKTCFSFKAFRIQQNQVCILFDNITEKKKYYEEIKYVSYHDILTGLYNRTYFMSRLNEIDKNSKLPLSVIMGDVNGLKLINDLYGHELGDKYLIKISHILLKACPKNSLVSRWGGDEFTILLPKTSGEEVGEIMYRIRDKCNKTRFESIVLSISLGMAIKTDKKQKMEDILAEAENMMYAHKLIEGKSVRNSIITSLQKSLFEKSCETQDHATRMMELANKIGNKISLSQNEFDEIKLLTMLHDIGKMGISDKILNKASSLTEKEWNEIKKHPEIGHRIAQAIPELSRISELILCHHEHYDGSGYPQGLTGENIPLLARVLAIIDAFDVMTNGRPYKKPMSKEEAFNELIRSSGSQFDPDLVKKFLEIANL